TTGDTRMWGVEILGNAVETVLYQRFLVPASVSLTVALIGLMALGAACVVAAARRPRGGRRARALRHRGGGALRARARARSGVPTRRAPDELRGRPVIAPGRRAGGAADGARGDGTLPLAGGEPVGAGRPRPSAPGR